MQSGRRESTFVSMERGVKMAGSSVSGVPEFSKQAVKVYSAMNDKRVHEKEELRDLNQRFTSYIDRVRELEALNRRLLAAIEELKGKWGLDASAVKNLMEPQLKQVRETIDQVTKIKALAEIRAKRAETDALQYRHLMDVAMDTYTGDKNKIKNLQVTLEATKQDADYIRNQFDDLRGQIDRYIEEQRRLLLQLKEMKDQLDAETEVRG